MEQIKNTSTQCANCGTELQGKFCYKCGEKQVDPDRDFSAWHFFKETLESLLHLDSKILRTFWCALVKPGMLTAEFIAGRRTPYVKPIPLFFISGLIFYLFFPTSSSFFSNPDDLNNGYRTGNWAANSFHFDTPSLIAQKAAALNMDAEVFVQRVSKEVAASRAKAYLFVMIPFLGAFFWLLFFRRQPWLVPHLIFAMHWLVFFILFDLFCLIILAYGFKLKQIGEEYVIFLLIFMLIWSTLAIRRVYGLKIWGAVAAGLVSTMAFLVIFSLYRQMITLWSLWSYI
jgi:Protein of unknown function (DUF3667)